MSAWRSVPEQSAILLVDIQEKLLPEVQSHQALISRISLLCHAAETLAVPVYTSEQVPEKLGATIPEILELFTPVQTLAKTQFSAAGIADSAKDIKHWILCGIETHICIRQTALDFLEKGMNVSVLSDTVSARNLLDSETALSEMRVSGIRVTTVESLLFEWMKTSEHPRFRTVSRLVKNH